MRWFILIVIGISGLILFQSGEMWPFTLIILLSYWPFLLGALVAWLIIRLIMRNNAMLDRVYEELLRDDEDRR